MNESDLKHGVVSKGKVLRKLRRISREKLGKASIPYDWTKTINIPNITIKNQYSSSSCGGQAGSYFIQIVDRALSHQDIEFSAKSIYAPIAYPQGGCTVWELENQIANKGANFESDVRSYKADGTTDEPFMADESFETPELSAKALRDAHRRAITVGTDMESVAEAIRDYGAVILEVGGKDNGTWFSPYPKAPNGPSDIVWRHYVCAAGVSNKQIDFLNSWGNTVGNNGIQHLNEDFFKSGCVLDAFTFYPVSIGTPDNSNWLWRFYKRMLKLFLA